jgi:hypothetical protein
MSQLNTHFLVNDIDLDLEPAGQARVRQRRRLGAHPYAHPFAGSFNGGHHTIRNLVIRAKAQSNWHLTSAGLFGGIDRAAVVRDLKIEGADVQVLDRRAGILAGENAGRVINCQVTGRVSSNMVLFPVDEVGGLIGRNTGDVINCRADTDWVWGNQWVGGLVGSNDSKGIIAGCRAVGKQVGVYKHGVGGLVGINRGCVIGSEAMGGIVGQDVSHLYGGLAGINSGTIFNCHAGSDIVAGTRCSKLGGSRGKLGTTPAAMPAATCFQSQAPSEVGQKVATSH